MNIRVFYLLFMVLIGLGSAPGFVLSQEVSGEFTRIAPADPTEEELFRSTFSNDTFKSEYFGFSISIPKKWHRMAEADTRIRQETKDFVAENSKIDVSKVSNARSNMFTFTIKPHGASGNYQIRCLIQKVLTPRTTAEQESGALEKSLILVRGFSISEKTHQVSLGENTFYMFETVATINGNKATQAIFHILRKGYVLTFTLGYNEKTKPVLVDSLKTLKFESH